MREAPQAMIPRIEGKPCVYINRYTRQVFVCLRLGDIQAEEDYVTGRYQWADLLETWLDNLAEEFHTGYDLLEFGPDCWHDEDFQVWCVIDLEMVARSMRRDHAWVMAYLLSTLFPPLAGRSPAAEPRSTGMPMEKDWRVTHSQLIATDPCRGA
ncbi:MAG: hypothetical protein U0835_17155 [Isosphaeraceae bacterium]